VAYTEVRDDGRGIAEAEQRRVFDPFFTTRLELGGTGLGLSVAHGVITGHEGQIRVESKPGEGTAVAIELPLHEEGAVRPSEATA
jgi:signal transduction histidine kinase